MCGPIASAAVGIAGAVISGIGRKQQIDSQARLEKKQAKNQARQYGRQGRYAARDIRRTAEARALDFLTQSAIHARQALLERVRGAWNAARLGERGTRIIGAATAGYGDSGIAIAGTVADVVSSTAAEIGKDIAATRLSTRIASENETILAGVSRRDARRTLELGEASAKDALRYGKEAAADTLKYGAAAGVAIRAGSGLAIAAPVIQTVGTFLGSGVFQSSPAPAAPALY